MNAREPIAEGELLTLWQHGRRIAAARCAGTLGSLRRGAGGFYEADDLWQDLFLEFWELVRRWRRSPAPRALDDLWAEWRRLLWLGGARVLRRSPQRLWTHADPGCRLPTADDDGDGPPAHSTSSRGVRGEGREPEDGLAAQAALDAVTHGLWSAGAVNRQALYLTAIVGLSADEAARCLGLRGAHEVYWRVHNAREAARHGGADATRGRP